jgi:hypothetical protein
MKGFLIGSGILLGIVTIAGAVELVKRAVRKKANKDIGIIVNDKTGEWRPL